MYSYIGGLDRLYKANIQIAASLDLVIGHLARLSKLIAKKTKIMAARRTFKDCQKTVVLRINHKFETTFEKQDFYLFSSKKKEQRSIFSTILICLLFQIFSWAQNQLPTGENYVTNFSFQI